MSPTADHNSCFNQVLSVLVDTRLGCVSTAQWPCRCCVEQQFLLSGREQSLDASSSQSALP